jgi:DNA-binding response OmpR family regulator
VNVLVVSRDAHAHAWARGALGSDAVIREAGNGLEAIDMARREPVDAVVADETSEPYGAFGLARELKLLPDPPVVVVLLERAQDTWLAKWSRADRWFVQPVDPFALAAAIQELVAARARGEGAAGGTEPAAAWPEADAPAGVLAEQVEAAD